MTHTWHCCTCFYSLAQQQCAARVSAQLSALASALRRTQGGPSPPMRCPGLGPAETSEGGKFQVAGSRGGGRSKGTCHAAPAASEEGSRDGSRQGTSCVPPALPRAFHVSPGAFGAAAARTAAAAAAASGSCSSRSSRLWRLLLFFRCLPFRGFFSRELELESLSLPLLLSRLRFFSFFLSCGGCCVHCHVEGRRQPTSLPRRGLRTLCLAFFDFFCFSLLSFFAFSAAFPLESELPLCWGSQLSMLL